MKSSKLLRVVACLLLICMVLGACSSNNGGNNGGNTSQPAGGEVVNGQKTGGKVKDGILFALNAEPTSLDPQVAAERITYIPVMQLYDRLVMEDPETREIKPMLAESWEFNDDNTEITFKIKEGVKFHDGSTMTVERCCFLHQPCYQRSSEQIVLQRYGKNGKSGRHPLQIDFEICIFSGYVLLEQRAVLHCKTSGGRSRQRRLQQKPHRHRPLQICKLDLRR